MGSTIVKIGGTEILVDTDEVGAELARPRAERYDIEGLEPTGVAGQVADAGEEIRAIITAVTGSIQKAFEASSPDEWSVELLVGFKGEAGIPFVTKGEANASLKLKAKWTKD